MNSIKTTCKNHLKLHLKKISTLQKFLPRVKGDDHVSLLIALSLWVMIPLFVTFIMCIFPKTSFNTTFFSFLSFLMIGKPCSTLNPSSVNNNNDTACSGSRSLRVAFCEQKNADSDSRAQRAEQLITVQRGATTCHGGDGALRQAWLHAIPEANEELMAEDGQAIRWTGHCGWSRPAENQLCHTAAAAPSFPFTAENCHPAKPQTRDCDFGRNILPGESLSTNLGTPSPLPPTLVHKLLTMPSLYPARYWY